jgi:Flp pilus assembly CpaE family ATPase
MSFDEDTIVTNLPMRVATQVRRVKAAAGQYVGPEPSAPPRAPAVQPLPVAPEDDPEDDSDEFESMDPTIPAGSLVPVSPGGGYLDRRLHRTPEHTPSLSTGPSRSLATDKVRRGKVMCFFGCRGGAGSTTLAVNTAAMLVRAQRSVVIVDLDLQLGDVFVALDLEPTTSIAGLAREVAGLDGSAVRRRLVRHDAGFYALTQAGRIDDIDVELVDRLPGLVEALASHFDYVLVDGIRDFGDYSLSVLDRADRIALILAQDVASVRRAARVMSLFRQLGYDGDRMRLVLNRATRRAAVTTEAIERTLGMRVCASVGNDYKRMRAAFDDGALISEVAGGAQVARDLARLTVALVRRPEASRRAMLKSAGTERSFNPFRWWRKK